MDTAIDSTNPKGASKLVFELSIVKLDAKDIGVCADSCLEFHREAKIPGEFDVDVFIEQWGNLIDTGIGAVFVGFVDGELAGYIAGITMYDFTNSRNAALEQAWFVLSSMRETGIGAALLDEFEGWATDNGATYVRMAHLLNTMPEVVAKTLQDRGYKSVEVLYQKEF